MVSILTALLTYPHERVFEVLNIHREPIRVLVNGVEYSVDYINC